MVRRAVRARLGSTLGFSQPLSGFLAVPSFAALFRAATSSWDPPFRAFPSQRSAHPSRGRLLPCSYPPTCLSALPVCRVTPGFTDSHAFTRSPGSPSGYERPFHEPKSASRLLWAPSSRTTLFRQLHLLRSFDPPASPFATSPSCPVLAADSLLGFFPSRVFSNHALGPRPAQASRT